MNRVSHNSQLQKHYKKNGNRKKMPRRRLELERIYELGTHIQKKAINFAFDEILTDTAKRVLYVSTSTYCSKCM